MPDTFIERHGLIQYGKHALRSLPRPRWCEICKSPDHITYQLDHCHVHGWVRGVLCSPCNMQMGRVDAGKVPLVPPYAEHWRLCPDCLTGGAALPQPKSCAGCDGNGVMWLPNVARMVPCPLCRHSASRAAVRESVTESEKSAETHPMEKATQRDENGAPEIDERKPAPLGASFARVVSPGNGTARTPVTVRVLPPSGASNEWSLTVTADPGVPVRVIIQVTESEW